MSPPVLKPSVPIPIDDKVLIDVISKAKDFAIMHGSAMRSKADYSPDTLQVKFISCLLKILTIVFSVCSIHPDAKFISQI